MGKILNHCSLLRHLLRPKFLGERCYKRGSVRFKETNMIFFLSYLCPAGQQPSGMEGGEFGATWREGDARRAGGGGHSVTTGSSQHHHILQPLCGQSDSPDRTGIC